MDGWKSILTLPNIYEPSHFGNQRAISGKNNTSIIPIIWRAIKGKTAINISWSVISGGATDFNQKQAGPKGGDRKYICMFITNNTPNHTAAQAGSRPNSGAIPTTTGAKTGTKWYGVLNFNDDNKVATFSDWMDVNGIQVQIENFVNNN